MQIKTSDDPYFRHKVVVSQGEHSTLITWIISLLLVIGLAAGLLWYFHPQIINYVDTWIKDYKTSQSGEKIPSSPINAQSELSATRPDIPQTVEPVLTASKPSNTELETTTSIESRTASTNGANEPSATEIKQNAYTPEEIEAFVVKAQTQIKNTRLTTPEGDNAYETYRQLTAISSEKAEEVLNNIVDWYIDKTKSYLKRNRITLPERGNAYQTYQKLMSIAPDNKRAKSLLRPIFRAFDDNIKEHVRKDRFLHPPTNNMHNSALKMLKISPDHPESQRILNKVIKALLRSARKQMEKKKYTTPHYDNAYSTYKAILKLDANNRNAKTGIDTIANRYYSLAVEKQEKGYTKISVKMIEKGLAVKPADPALLALKEQLLSTGGSDLRDPHEAMLLKARRQIAEGKLKQPVGDNAYETYQILVKVASDHPQLDNLLELIGDKYTEEAREKYNNKQWQQSLALITDGLSIIPDHSGLNQLKEDVLVKLAE